MSDSKTQGTREETAVDDVRHIRAQLDSESGGDVRKHVQQTNRVVEELRERLGLRVVDPPTRPRRRNFADSA